ncbi:MAG: class 1 fructose-bisphosphatase [Deltaproteobacteria bacterium]|nr:class 1 fructose-bisphosphatase [Deltaproteobacteria bacterium]
MANRLGVTVTNHLLAQQELYGEATGAFTRLLNELILSAKIISREVTKAGLVEILGFTGERNVQGEQVRKLDEFAHDNVIDRLSRSGYVAVMGSEEDADPIELPRGMEKGNYVVLFDPLDGSSNIDANVSIGTIFSILRKVSTGVDYEMKDLLQPGYQQVAAGYFLYGSSTMMVYTAGNGVSGFTLDPSVGEFLLSHPQIKMPTRGKIFSANMGYMDFWTEGVQEYFRYLRRKTDQKPVYSCRYIGSLVADFHRTLLYGGIFLYPADTKDPKKPHGKLRLLYECSPLAFVAEQAGGAASDGQKRIMEIEPDELHQRVPYIVGSAEDVAEAVEFISGRRKL